MARVRVHGGGRRGLAAGGPARSRLLTSDYREASPLVLLGRGLPAIYSGYNSYWSRGPPPADDTIDPLIRTIDRSGE